MEATAEHGLFSREPGWGEDCALRRSSNERCHRTGALPQYLQASPGKVRAANTGTVSGYSW